MFYICSAALVRTQRRVIQQLRARDLRIKDTRAETQLWNAIHDRRLGGWRWRRQVPFGPFILDFLCREARLVIELDGAQHADQVAYDARRTAYLAECGLRVLRFWNEAVFKDRDGVCMLILDACGGERDLGPSMPR